MIQEDPNDPLGLGSALSWPEMAARGALRSEHEERIAQEKARVAAMNAQIAASRVNNVTPYSQAFDQGNGLPVYEEKRTATGRVMEKRDLDNLGIARKVYTDEYGYIYRRPFEKTADATDALLEQRGQQHGDFAVQSALAQRLKNTLCIAKYKEGEISADKREALEMICVKMSRILCGNPSEPDHWADIAGYARLIERQLIKDNTHDKA